MLEYRIMAKRNDAHGSIASCKQAQITLDTDINGRPDAFNPAELLLASLAACILKNIDRVAPIIHFDFRGVRIEVHGERQDKPPKMSRIDYRVIIDTDENDQKLKLLHQNIQKFGTIYNTVSAATRLEGVLVRDESVTPEDS